MGEMLFWLSLALQAVCSGCTPNSGTISEVRVSAVTESQVRVEWSTKTPSDSQVGLAAIPSTTYAFTTCCQPTATVSHEVSVSGLTPGTAYNFIVRSYDGKTHLVSSVGQFTTAFAGDDNGGSKTPPRRKAGTVHAFPDAQGGGAGSMGGRGGRVFEVTTLADSGAGSLRACLEGAGPRTCIFRVNGLITFLSRAQVSNPFLTIAGQTAPGEVVIGGPNQQGEQIFISTHDVVIRYLTYDGNNPNTRTGPDTGTVCCEMASGDVYNVMWDHISARWMGNKAFPVVSNVSGKGIHNITIQWTLLYEPNVAHAVGIGTLYVSSGSGLATTDNDAHHNMFVTVDHRIPLNQSGRNVRWVNNLTYNWGQFAALTMGGVQSDYIGNKYVDGSGGNLNYSNVHVFLANGNGCDPKDEVGDCPNGNSGDNETGPTAYLLNNIGHAGKQHGGAMVPATHTVNDAGQISMTAQGWEDGDTGDPNSRGPWPSSWFRSTPLPAEAYPITADPVENLDAVLLPTVGNSQHLDCNGNFVNNRDSQDARIIDVYQTRAPDNLFTGQWQPPAIPAGKACRESIHDGVPDQWKLLHGLSTSDAGLAPRQAPNGYTYLENYLNGTDPAN